MTHNVVMEFDRLGDRSLAAGQRVSDLMPFTVCGEAGLTVVAGWDAAGPEPALRLTTPAGRLINAFTPGVVSSNGSTWAYLVVPLPQAGENDGSWTVELVRGVGRDEFASLPALTFCVRVIATASPSLPHDAPETPAYTGNTIDEPHEDLIIDPAPNTDTSPPPPASGSSFTPSLPCCCLPTLLIVIVIVIIVLRLFLSHR